MKKIYSVVCLLSLMNLSGCSLLFTDPETEQFEETKLKLEREIELLRLERRKILLNNSLDELDEESVLLDGE